MSQLVTESSLSESQIWNMFCSKVVCLLLYVCLYIGIPRVSSSESDWPSGWYGLPQPKAGCPSTSGWDSGWWYEDRRLNNQSTARVPHYSHLEGNFTQAITKRYFCIKKRDNRLKNTWPNGQYCVYKALLKPCPPGFVNGSIEWKNKDALNNNHHPEHMKLPSGVFNGKRTRINYCCKTDGSKENSISLPINRAFVLLAYNSSECQSVKWATTTQEYLRFSVEENITFRGFHPFVDDTDYALRYCYYKCSNKTLTAPRGTISRCLNQTSIHQERYTAWHIMPNSHPFQLLVLRFTRFTFHASNISSYMEILDGRNESAPSLGRFSSTQSPLGQNITSSTNQLFVVLHFGDRSGTYDFEFNYHISPAVSTTAEIKTTSHPPTSLTTKITSSSPYTSTSKVTSSPSTTLSSTYFNNVTVPTNSTATSLYSHGNDINTRLLLYILLPTCGLVVVIGIGVVIFRRRRKRIAYSTLTSLSIDEIVSELNDNMDGCFERIEPGTSCAVLQITSVKHEGATGMTTLMDTTEHTSSSSADSDDEMMRLHRNPPDLPDTELQNLNTSRRTSIPYQYESDPDPDHSRHVANEELRKLHEEDEEEMSEAERIGLIRLLGENHQEQYHLPQPNEAKNQASNC